MAKKNKLSQKEVRHIAKLANLKLTPGEVIKFQKQLGDILDYVSLLDQLNTKDVKPTSQVTGLKNVFRKDKVKSSLTQKEALANTKKKYKGYFKIKSIF